MARLFGTDGVRGIANKDLSCELAMKIGAAGAHVLTNEVHDPRILIGADTRLSGDMLMAALTAGICSVGGEVINVGVIPTPAMAYLVRLYSADAAVMVSASHNTMEYNGIKWFNGEGRKLLDELEDEIETLIKSDAQLDKPIGKRIGHVIEAKRAVEEYEAFLTSSSASKLDGLKIVLDCANGASSAIAREVFSALGATVLSYFDKPDGSNINDACGSTHPERLQELVTECGADVGFAFDGDADRVMAADERGNIVDGDRIMGLCAKFLKSQGKLKKDTLVVTVMSNLGLKRKMEELGIHVEETIVGDRYVLERMVEKGLSIGGEQSGHIIFLDLNTTGDGMLSAIQVLNVMKTERKKLSALANEIPIYPQMLVNVIVEPGQKQAAMEDKELHAAIDEVEKSMEGAGRVLVRASGTEPMIRIMLEGQDEEDISAKAIRLAKILEKNYKGHVK